ncbi:MAG: class I tRNA ligase family protein [Fimbriimonas sp.]|nr:class I tRNA ligase family protein [Fimbriimonas sp.]
MYKKVTNFPKFVEIEHEMLAFWEREDVFAKLRDQIAGKRPWSFLDGPITANNPMGVHHAWGRTLKDIYQRFHAMRGFDVRFQNGFDCQGLWVEVEVEKEHGFATKQDIVAYGIENFVRECKERVLTFSARQTEQSKRLGYWMDWDDPDGLRGLGRALHDGENKVSYRAASGVTVTGSPESICGRLGSPELGGSYFTFSEENNYSIWNFLKTCHEEGNLARTTDVMPWCTRCGTSLSQMEVAEGRRILSHTSVYVRCPIRGREREAFLIWTTTPWTLPANVAVALNPKQTYLKVRHGEWTYYMGKENFDHERKATLEAEGAQFKRSLPSLRRVLKNAGHEPEVLGEFLGEDLIGLGYDGPFDHLSAQQRPGGVSPYPTMSGQGVSGALAHVSIAWTEVTGQEGTGVVHIAPGCGSEDYQLGVQNDLPVIAPLEQDGTYLSGFGPFDGHKVADVNREVVGDLKERGLLVAREEYAHVYPQCWRCKTELVFRLVDGWKIKMDWRGDIAQVVPTATWIPADGEKRELDWLKNMGDWLISKNRFWGLALPIWECGACGGITVIGSKEELKQRATSGWDIFEGHSPHRPFVDAVKLTCDHCGGTAERIPEVGNPWLDAGIVALSTMRYNTDRAYWEKWFPADLILESFPGQFRNWFYALLAMSVKMTGQAPFRTLLGHALVHDERGEEMHKSKGNSIAFDEAAEIVGAEPMRYIFASQPTVTHLRFPDIRRQDGGKTLFDDIAIRRIATFWNCYKFLITYAEVEDWKPSSDAPACEEILDRWILSRLESLVSDANRLLGEYQVHRFLEQMERFNDELSNWYLRRSRSRFWVSGPNASKEAAFRTLYDVLKTLILLFAPILPFLAEEVYQSMVREAEPNAPVSVHLAGYPQPRAERIDRTLEARIEVAIRLKNLVLSIRNQQRIRVRQPLQQLWVRTTSEMDRATLSDPLYQQMIMDETNVLAIGLLEGDSDLIRPIVKINFRVLGPKLDNKVQLARKRIEESDPVVLHDALVRGESIEIDLDGQKTVLNPEDLVVTYEQVGNLFVTSQPGLIVALDTELNEDLLLAGLARDLNRAIQTLRKSMNLEMTQRIQIHYEATGQLAEAIARHRDFLMSETLADSLVADATEENSSVVEVGEDTLRLGIEAD